MLLQTRDKKKAQLERERERERGGNSVKKLLKASGRSSHPHESTELRERKEGEETKKVGRNKKTINTGSGALLVYTRSHRSSTCWGISDRIKDGIVVHVPMCCMQVPPPQVPARVRVRALLPAGPAAEIRQRPQGVRGEQRDQAAQRAPPPPARGRGQLSRLRGRHAPAGPGLRLRRGHLPPPAPAPPAPDGPHLRQVRALQVPEPRHRRRPRPHRCRRRRGHHPQPPPEPRHQPPRLRWCAGPPPLPPPVLPPRPPAPDDPGLRLRCQLRHGPPRHERVEQFFISWACRTLLLGSG
ncbi:uncharacterized protein J3R85_005531 [Psidium guajava]|nr:uncharacterized protein J3R85_005531 [Psidium guajava]